jgi:cyclopropane fatty-acyl-phospholipid synthase-like methyltransferase
VSERLRSILEAMRVQPDDEVLEIGCGHGVAATLICQKLRGGRLLAIDRSKKMIDAAVRRNKEYLEAGKAEFRLADVMKFDPGPQRFDKILAVRVGLLHRDEDKARRHLEKWLKPKGKIFLVYDEP